MGKRGPRSKLTDDSIERVKQLYQGGAAHRAIAEQLGISETNVRRIIGLQGIPKRERKLATLLTPAEEDALVRYLLTLGPFRGKYRTLRNLMEQFAQENGMKCTFTYSWRDGFVRRHRHRLPGHIIKLLSPKVQKDDDMDSDLDILDASGEIQVKEPSVWKQKPKLTSQQRAMKETTKAFLKAGLSKEEAHLLLVKLKVPGMETPSTPPVIPPLDVETTLPSSDVVAQALNNVFGESSGEPEPSSVVTPEGLEAPPPVKAKRNRKTPVKKTAFQIEVLEKAFAKSQTCGDKRAKRLGRILGLTAPQIIYWFHNSARHKRKLTGQPSLPVSTEEISLDGDLEGVLEGEAVVDGEHMVENGEHMVEGEMEGEEAVETLDQGVESEAVMEDATVEA